MRTTELNDVDWRAIAAQGVQSMHGLEGPAKVQGRIRVCGAVHVLHLRGESVEMTLDRPPLVAPHMTFAFVEAGNTAAREGKAPWRTLNAPLIISPDGVSHSVRYLGHWKAMIVRLPRVALEAVVSIVPLMLGAFPSTRMLDRAMHRFAAEVLSDAEMTVAEAHDIEHLLVEMAAAVLLDRLGSGWTEEDPHAALRRRAVSVIRAQCARPDLDPAAVAAEVRAPLRTLQAVFAEIGTTVSGEIRRQRARIARGLLTDSRFDGLSVEQVARRSGFGTVMTLRRTFDMLYGVHPSTLRSTRGLVAEEAQTAQA